MRTVVVAVVAFAACATPALADFFIVRDSPTAPCRVVETRPADKKIVVIGDKAYTTRADAEKQVTLVCK